MPVAYQLFAVDSFPKDRKFKTAIELSLFGDDDNNIETTETVVEQFGTSADHGFSRFDSLHEFVFRLQYPGRARGKVFREFVTPYRFTAYLGDDHAKLGFRPLLVRTKKSVAADFIERLNTNVQDFKVRRVGLDFTQLRPRLQQISGAWFGSMREDHVTSTGVFGPGVDRSHEFKHAERVGEITNLVTPLEVSGVTHTVMLGADGSVLLYQGYQTEAEELVVVSECLESLLAGCVSPHCAAKR